MQKKEKISKIKNAPAKKFIHVFAPAHHHPAESLGGVGFLPGSCGTVARRQRHGDNAYLRQSSLGPAEQSFAQPMHSQPTCNLETPRPANTSQQLGTVIPPSTATRLQPLPADFSQQTHRNHASIAFEPFIFESFSVDTASCLNNHNVGSLVSR